MAKKYLGENSMSNLIRLIKGIFDNKQDKVVEDPVNATDAVNKNYLDNSINEVKTMITEIDGLCDKILEEEV